MKRAARFGPALGPRPGPGLRLGLWLLPATLAAGTAAAQTVTTVTITPDFNANVTVTGANPGNGLTAAIEHARTLDALATASSDGNAIGSSLILSGSGNVEQVSTNRITAGAPINSSKQQVGIIAQSGATDGAAIATTEIVRFASLAAFVEDNEIRLTADFTDSGRLNATVDDNAIQASALFNAGFNLIETTVPLELATPPDGASYAAIGSIELTASASLSIVSTQLNNSLSGQEWQPPEGDPVLVTAVADGNAILLDASAPAGESLAGSLSLSGNAIQAVTRAQVSESAIVLHDQIATANGPVIGDGTFQGTALIYGLQNNDDISDPDLDSKGQGLHSYVAQSEIVATLDNGDATSTPGALSTLSLTQDDNSLRATARANETSNEINFDPALALAGPSTGLDLIDGENDALDVDEEVVRFQERLGLRDATADYLIVSRQSMNRRDEVDPVVTAAVLGSRIGADIDTASANSSISLSGNTVQALAEGNTASHAIHNSGDEASPVSALVDAVVAIVNWQWITAPDIVADVAPAEGESIIALDVDLIGPGGTDGALDAGVFDASGNTVSARSNGNRGTSAIDLEATLMSLTLASETPAGSTTASAAYLDTERGATNDGDNFTASAGATLFNYQIVDSADASHGEDDFLEPALRSTLLDGDIRTSLNLDPTALATGLTNLDASLDSNSAEARAEANAYDGSLALAALTTWTGSAGGLSVQIDNDQSIVASVLDSDIALEITVDGGAGSLDTADLSLFGNRVLAVATVNRATQTADIDATVIEGAGWRADYDPTDPQSSLSAVVEGYEFNQFVVTRFRGTANGAVALLSDQTGDESGALAEMQDSGIALTIDSASLDASKLDLSSNVVAAQARINDASNGITLDATVLRNGGGETAGEIDLPPGPLATIVAIQGSGRGEVDTDDPGRLTEVRATLADSGIDIDVPELSASSLSVDNAMITATAAANVTSNAIDVEAVSIVAGLGDVAPTSQIAFNSNNTDYDYSIVSSFSILSSQRNESQQFDGEPRGPAIIATLENPDGEAAVDVHLNNGMETGKVSIDGASSSAVARGNVANNVINLEAVTIEGSAHIVSRQGNDGDVSATNTNGGMSLVLNEGGGGALSAGQVSMGGNSIQATAIGNAVVNVVRADTTGGFVGPGVGDPAVVNADLPIDGEVTVSAGLSVLNSQFNGGTEEDRQTISATVENGRMQLTVNGTTSASSITMPDNRVDATAIGNFASNEITSLSSGGALPSASVYNRQLNEHSDTTATVNGGGVSFVATGVVSGSTFNSMNSSVSANAIGNSAVNTVTTSNAAP